jgi:hypothetical protein
MEQIVFRSHQVERRTDCGIHMERPASVFWS